MMARRTPEATAKTSALSRVETSATAANTSKHDAAKMRSDRRVTGS
jgi:hypothetical protein